jgi:two-component system sensor histidine kinase KdpD
MGAASLACFAYAELYFPIPTEYEGYRWFGLLAAVSVGQATSVFVDRYRRRLRGHVAALEEAGNFRERQIAIMAHDIRSPVGAISGYASLLEDGVANDTEREQLVARMGATAWNVDLVVGNVLDLYQIEAAGPMLRRVEIDPNRIIEETVEDCAMQARRERVRLVADLATLPRGRFDPACLGRIVRNMLATAIRRARAGQVSIATRAGDGHLTLEVRDSGLPMPPHELERLFDPPSRDGGRKAPGGLAAHLVRTLTEAHGGRVEAKCEPGGGLVMIVELPLDTDAARGAR